MTQADRVRAFQEKLLAEIDPYLPIGGPPLSFRPALRDAFLACPRHRFLRRFKSARHGPVHELSEANLDDFLPVIYSESLQTYVDEAGEALAASNSEPGLVLYLLELLDLKPGQRALEIGSGGGWLTAILAHVVGPEGRAVGIEINEMLAAQSRRSLASLGVTNATIVCGDGALGHAPGAPYDRVTVTAGCDSFPEALFEQVAEGGLVVLPISNKGGGEEVFLLRREGARFRSEAAVNAWYVPLVGGAAIEGHDGHALRELPLWNRLKHDVCHRQSFWLGGRGARDLMARSYRFRTFLGKVEPRYRVFHAGADERFLFGLVDEAAGALALLDGNQLTAYGNMVALDGFLACYRRWCDLFMPSGVAFGLQIAEAGGAAPAGEAQWLERRGACDFLWSLSHSRGT